MDYETNYINRWGPHPHTVASTGSAASCGYLQTDGSLIYPYKWNLSDGGSLPSSAAEGGRIIKYDWDGNVLWNWQIPNDWGYMPHHDIEPIPNGNILLIVIENNSEGGTSDCVIEIEPDYTNNTATIIWTWKAVQHVDTTGTDAYKFSDSIEGGPTSDDWNHFNSIFMSIRDTIYLSSRNWDEFFVIPWRGGTGSTGDILYRWGNPENYGRGDSTWHQLDAQHGVNEISADYTTHGAENVILFNNGGQIGEPTSQILELAKAFDGNGDYTLPATDPFGPTTWTWKYDLTAPQSSNRQSGAFRLANGHTFGN